MEHGHDVEAGRKKDNRLLSLSQVYKAEIQLQHIASFLTLEPLSRASGSITKGEDIPV
jgi:hypothetical protein